MYTQDDKGIGIIESVARTVETLIGKRDFAGAIGYVESFRTRVDSDSEAMARLLHLAAKAHAGLGNHPKALKTARLAQATAEKSAGRLILAEIFMSIGGILRDMGEFKEAERAFRDAESVFRRNDGLEGQSRALNQLAGLFFRQNDYRNSLTVLMDAVEIARTLGDTRKLAFMMGNIGRISTFTGDFDNAIKHLRINIDLSIEHGDRLETARAWMSLAYVHIQKSEFSEAEKALDEAYPIIAETKSHRDEICYLTYLGELQYRAGRHDEAEATLTDAVAQAQQFQPDGPSEGRALRHLAELAIRRDNTRMARRYVSRALVIMQKAGDTVEQGALWKLRGQIADRSNHVASAKKHFRKAMDLLEESGVRWEKADALWAAGQAGAFSPRERMTYLFRAEEFYARTRDTRKLNEVGETISSLEQQDSPELASPGNGSGPGDQPSVDYLTRNAQIKQFKLQLPMLGRSDLPLLLRGETGTGKDHLARYYHSLVRPTGPYVAINCASVPETLLESELFGYRRGAFTGADGNKDGLFVRANGGVLLLDEIGDMPLALQAKLLGVLESRKVLPLGGTTETSLDVKLVAATNQDLETMVEAGTFRRDLYYRLSGLVLTLPPLRERPEDIGLLVQTFMRRRGLLGENDSVPAELLRQFVSYDWPGNIRELDNKIRRMEVMAQLVAEGDLVELARSMFGGEEPAPSVGGNLFERVEKFERELLLEALNMAEGNKCQAARILGVHEATVRTKLKRYGITYSAA